MGDNGMDKCVFGNVRMSDIVPAVVFKRSVCLEYTCKGHKIGDRQVSENVAWAYCSSIDF